MTKYLGFSGVCAGCLAAGLLAAAAESPPASKGAASPKKGAPNAAANSTNSEPMIAQSVFVMPANPQQGKDPFFPTSSYPYPAVRTTTTNKGPAITLKANGIVPFKLVMVSGKSLAEGEEADIKTESGPKHLRCIKIKEDSAIIDVDGERQEVKMRQGSL